MSTKKNLSSFEIAKLNENYFMLDGENSGECLQQLFIIFQKWRNCF